MQNIFTRHFNVDKTDRRTAPISSRMAISLRSEAIGQEHLRFLYRYTANLSIEFSANQAEYERARQGSASGARWGTVLRCA